MKGQEGKGKYRKGQGRAGKDRKGQKDRKGRKDLERREKGRKRRQEGPAICLSVFYYSIQLQVADRFPLFRKGQKGEK